MQHEGTAPTFVALLATLAAVACVGEPGAQSGTDPRDAATFELTRDRAFLWEITEPGSQQIRVFLLGSVHMLDVPIVLGPRVEQAFDDADALVLEVDLRGVTQEDKVELFARYAPLTWAEELSDFLSADTLRKLDLYTEKHGLPPQLVDGLDRMLPWAIANTLQALRLEQLGLLTDHGVDDYFLARAGSRMPVVGLETLDEQLFALSSHSSRIQELMLLEILEQPDDAQEAVELMLIEAWKTGDATALASFLLPPAAPENVEAYDEFYETIIFARNEVMADGIIELLEEGDDDDIYFVVVGAGHLIGENTVQSLLREEGYEANRASH